MPQLHNYFSESDPTTPITTTGGANATAPFSALKPVMPYDATPPNMVSAKSLSQPSQNYDPSKVNAPTQKQAFWNSLMGTSDIANLPADKQKEAIINKTMVSPTQAWAASKKTAQIIADMPAQFVKAPINITQGLFDLTQRLTDKITGYNPATASPMELAMHGGFGSKTGFDMPVLGHVAGMGADYREGINMGLSPLAAAVKATGQTAGDVALGMTGFDVANMITKPRLATVNGPMVAEDYRPLNIPTEETPVPKASTGAVKDVNTIRGGTPVQNEDVSYMRVSKQVASKYKGNPNNTFLKITPVGPNVAEYSIVQTRSSLLDQVKSVWDSKFGKSNVVTGQYGPEIKVDSATVKYDPQTLAENGITSKNLDPFARAKVEQANPELPMQSGKLPAEAPTLMAPPLKGFENKMITSQQADQILGLAETKEIPPTMIQGVVQAVTGQKNLYDLNQSQAYNVSETLRLYDQPKGTKIEQMVRSLKSYGSSAAKWMGDAETSLGVPLLSRVNIPLENGLNQAKLFHQNLVQKMNEVFGKYADPKYYQEQRLIDAYTRGNTDAILKNDSLTPEVKSDLSKIGDWLVSKYKGFLNDPQLFEPQMAKQARFLGKYAPEIEKLGTGIFNLYKDKGVIPSDITPFFQLKRQGSMHPLEDNPMALFGIYTKGIARVKFLKEALSDASKVIADTQLTHPELGAAANDYVQELLGYKDNLGKALDIMGQKLSESTNGLIPADAFNTAINMSMGASYAGALGIPNIMPIFRNSIQPLLTLYPELGEYTKVGYQRLAKEGLGPIAGKGLFVNMGLPYGSEISKLSESKGRQAIDWYNKMNQATLKGYEAVDQINRAVSAYGVEQRFLDNWRSYRSGKISWDNFKQGIDVKGMNPALWKVINQKLSKVNAKNLQDAIYLIQKDMVDKTQFPYRKAAAGRLFYGTTGKLGLQFGHWFAGYSQLINDWVVRGQWYKLIRLFGMGTMIKRAANEWGIDASKWVNFGPLANVPLGPAMKALYDGISAFNSRNMSTTFDQNISNVISDIKLYGGLPTGLGAQKIAQFWKSVERYQKGVTKSPDPTKPFGVWSSTGKLIQWTDFNGILENLFRFTPIERTQQSQRINTMEKANKKYQSSMNEAMDALINGNYKKFNSVVVKNNLQISDLSAKLKSYYTPLDQRIYDQMPLVLKAKYYKLFTQSQ